MNLHKIQLCKIVFLWDLVGLAHVMCLKQNIQPERMYGGTFIHEDKMAGIGDIDDNKRNFRFANP